MHYEGNVIRPPSEADSIILQVAVGCPHNRCTFCGAYREVRYRLKSDREIGVDLAWAARYCTRMTRVFLADGDVLGLEQERLKSLLARIGSALPWIKRLGLYANARSILGKSAIQLGELKELGLDRLYMGLESGHDPLLQRVRKGADAATMIAAGRRAGEAGLFLSVTVLLGIGGRELSQPHAEATGRVLTAMAPRQIAALTLMLLDNTELYQEAMAGRFRMPDHRGLLLELRTLLHAIDLPRVQFHANHASNYLPLEGRLPRDRERLLHLIDQALHGAVRLKPEHLRAL